MIEMEGQIERITYQNVEDGYLVAKIRTKKEETLVTIVGYMPSVSIGEVLKLKGYWENHKRYGEQFRVVSWEYVIPATTQGIEKYLGSGMIKGIGPETAKKIVSKFGKETLRIISEEIEKLKEVPTVGEKRIEMIKSAWNKNRELRDTLISLETLGLSQNLALKIFRQYGRDSLKVVRENPFRLAEDIYGIGFLTADKISKILKIDMESPVRIEAGINYVLMKASEEGHVYYPMEKLISQTSSLLGIGEEKIRSFLPKMEEVGKIVVEDSQEQKCVYMKSLYRAEAETGEALKKIALSHKRPYLMNTDKVIEKVEKKLSISLTQAQVQAVKASLENKITLITGGPGTGKTTVVKGIVEAYREVGAKVLLCAPTGRAAKKMQETTGYQAQTIHRLLEYNPHTKSFRRNERHPIDCDVLIVDESSMIDIILMHNLLKAIPKTASCVFVGDVDQLPSVGPGAVFRDMIDSNFATCVRLTEIFRQSRESLIIINAHRIMRGIMPILESKKGGLSDFLFYYREVPQSVVKTIIHLVGSYIPSYYGIAKEDIQVLTPMYKGEMGVSNLNSLLKDVVNPKGEEIERGGKSLRVGDRVIQMRNNYDKEVFNGDIGKIVDVDLDNRLIRVSYDNREITYDFSELDEIMPAYAISIHKSQGSEYESVIVPIMTHHYVLLQRNLVYTALTRAKRLAVFVGTKKALAIAIKNSKPLTRYTLLGQRLKDQYFAGKKNDNGILF
jgi:exodeoxyribonuclease V alpha subunit